MRNAIRHLARPETDLKLVLSKLEAGSRVIVSLHTFAPSGKSKKTG